MWWLYTGHTRHCRFRPVQHGFMYPVLYAGIDLPSTDQASNIHFLWAINRWAVLSFWEADYLNLAVVNTQRVAEGLKPQSLRDRVLFLLRSEFSVPQEEVGRIHVVTMPRWLGYAFNPLTVYYVYQQQQRPLEKETNVIENPLKHVHETTTTSTTTIERLLGVLLEVHNTFGESHVYFLPSTSRMATSTLTTPVPPRRGFTQGHRMKRQFHVSPFNDHRGDYTIYSVDPFEDRSSDGRPRVHIYILMQRALTSSLVEGKEKENKEEKKENENENEKEEKKENAFTEKILTAELHVNGQRLTPWVFFHQLLIVYPLTLWLTFPRILFEAFLLAYRKRLAVFPRPTVSLFRQRTLERIGPSWLEQESARPLFVALKHARIPLRLHLCTPIASLDRSITSISFDSPSFNSFSSTSSSCSPSTSSSSPLTEDVVEWWVHSHELWTWIGLLGPNLDVLQACAAQGLHSASNLQLLCTHLHRALTSRPLSDQAEDVAWLRPWLYRWLVPKLDPALASEWKLSSARVDCWTSSIWMRMGVLVLFGGWILSHMLLHWVTPWSEGVDSRAPWLMLERVAKVERKNKRDIDERLHLLQNEV